MEMIKMQGGAFQSLPDSVWKGRKASLVVSSALPYIKDEVDAVAAEAVLLITKSAVNSTDTALRRQVVGYLTECLSSKGAFTANAAKTGLNSFRASDFTLSSRKTIENLLTDITTYNYVEIARMAASKGIGYEAISMVFYNEKMNIEKKWSLAIALTRLGNKQVEEWILSKLNKANPEASFVEAIVPDLVFTRSKPVIDFCVSLLQDESLKCSCVNPDVSTKVECGYRIMEWLAPIVVNFPVKFDSIGMLKNDNEYKNALIAVRKWFNDNPEYEIIRTE